MPTITIDPITRLEGHLKVEVNVDGGYVSDAKVSGTMFRGFEIILKDRDPRDAPILTQRICGVCPVSHAMASVMNLESAFGVTPTDNGRILRNLVLGANFIMSHILHFYHLAALDYIDTTGVVDMSPWTPRYVTPDMVGGSLAGVLVNHYVQALAVRRKAHQMGAIFSGKLPCPATFVPGGHTEVVKQDKIDDFRTLLTELRDFIDNTYIPDVKTAAGAVDAYWGIGTGCGNMLAYGVFDLNASGTNRLLKRGRSTGLNLDSVDPAQISEYVKHSWYEDSSSGLNPSVGVTEPDMSKPDAYSWLKSPRYMQNVYETGPLARMVVSYLHGEPTVQSLVDNALGELGKSVPDLFSVLGRHAARALECKFVADSMDSWLNELVVGDPVYNQSSIPQNSSGIGLTEAPRGALGHWIEITGSKISRYQVITPTNWNASPKDDLGQNGPIEQALIGTPVSDPNQPVEVLRVIHSFDPCLACSVHVIRPKSNPKRFVVNI
jgi:hydrogenase large subunit